MSTYSGRRNDIEMALEQQNPSKGLYNRPVPTFVPRPSYHPGSAGRFHIYFQKATTGGFDFS